MKLVGSLLLASTATILSVEARNAGRQDWIVKKQNAMRILASRRRARDNTDLFEEIQKGDRERECVEEKCDFEEVRETYEDQDGAERWWKKAVQRCSTDKEKCDPKHTLKCINKWQEKVCVCRPGWTGTLCTEDIDECLDAELKVQCGDKSCQNNVGSFTCGCDDGYTQLADGSCEDDNECGSGNGGCEHDCKNTEGSFECACNSGYELSGKTECVDSNECDQNPCGENSECNNNDGSFSCDCLDGFSHGFGDTNSEICEDIDECETETCPGTSVCVNTHGSFTCNCEAGFEFVNGACEDINECSAANPCDPNECVNTEGGFECKCWDGYRKTDESSRSDSGELCEDVDECADSPCLPGNTCINTDGSFVCECDGVGYEIIGGTCACTDAACALKDCAVGFEPNPADLEGDCIDTNECATNNGGCGGTCVNTKGGFHCECDAGYVLLSDNSCADDDECSGDVCQSEGVNHCVNMQGGYECSCTSGFVQTADKHACEDINECEQGRSMCDEGEVCKNIPGGFTCEDKDSNKDCGCKLDNKCDHQCNELEDCSIECSCWPGYVLSCDGHTCLKDHDAVVDVDDMLSQEDCPDGFVKLGGKYSAGCSGCYFASVDKTDRDHAATVCAGLGASLAVVENKEQNFYLSELFDTEDQFWIGAKWNSAEDDFYWDDGSEIKFSRWAQNEPSTALADIQSQDPEYCVVGNWGYPGHWNDLPCAYNEARYACSMNHKCGGARPVVSDNVVEATEAAPMDATVSSEYDDDDDYVEYDGDEDEYDNAPDYDGEDVDESFYTTTDDAF